MAERKRIEMSTTDWVPSLPEGVEIRDSILAWSGAHENISYAYEALAKWARNNNYDAVVGICLEAHPATHYGAVPHSKPCAEVDYLWDGRRLVSLEDVPDVKGGTRGMPAPCFPATYCGLMVRN